MKRALLLFLVACVAHGCEPVRDQWKVLVATDAPVPQFGEQLLAELIDANGNLACSDCRRILDGSHLGAWPISFGIIPASSTSPRLRVRLYRLSETGSDGLPGTSALIEATARLPAPSGVTTVAITLSVSCFGVPADLHAALSCDPATGTLAPERLLARASPEQLPMAGSWPPAKTVPCPSAPPPGMVCVPGGAFLIGSSLQSQAIVSTLPERLVQISPFAMDAEETTVGQIRELAKTQGFKAISVHDANPTSVLYMCTYLGPDDPTNDAMPANCMSFVGADLACTLMGKKLPTEARWEWAAGNLGRETEFPWGNDTDTCAYAVVAHGRILNGDNTTCADKLPPGPVAGGSRRDKTDLGLFNLGGNVQEWVVDSFDPYTGPCWPPGLLVDPVCDPSVSNNPTHGFRGGGWSTPAFASAATRSKLLSDMATTSTGIRCVMDF